MENVNFDGLVVSITRQRVDSFKCSTENYVESVGTKVNMLYLPSKVILVLFPLTEPLIMMRRIHSCVMPVASVSMPSSTLH